MTTLEARDAKPGAKFQVIGAGLPRTGTNSLCAALEILLGGPAYHIGVQTSLHDDSSHLETWINVLQSRPYASKNVKRRALNELALILKGYVAAADSPAMQLVPELMKLYPDAKVICTTRDAESWAGSAVQMAQMFRPKLFRFIFFWVGDMRRLPTLWSLFTKVYIERYGVSIDSKADAMTIWERHHAWLGEVVPKDRLFYFDVKDGWEPLCKALNVPVPKNRPFPRLNDSTALEGVFRQWAITGLLRWFLAVAVVIGFVIVALMQDYSRIKFRKF